MTEQVTHARRWPIILAAAFIVVGCAAWVFQLTAGLLAGSGMSNTFAWGLMIAMFAFLVGFGAGSQFVASYIVLAHRRDLMPYVKTAQAIALAGAIGAGVAILIDLGHPAHILSMVMNPNPTSALTWDMIALSCFIIVAIINLIAVARNSKLLKFWMALGAIAAFALQLVEGLLFALMETRLWWHSFIMPVDFIVVAIVCGLAIAVIACSRTSGEYKPEALRDLCFILSVAIAIHIILALIDLAVVCFAGDAASAATLSALGSAWPLYALELALPIVAIFVLMRGKGAQEKNMLVGGILVVVGMFCHRLMLLYPAFGSPTLFVSLSNEPSPSWPIPASTGLYNPTGRSFEIAQGYLANVFEWASALLPLGIALAVFLVMMWALGKAGSASQGAQAATVEAAKMTATREVILEEDAVVLEGELQLDGARAADEADELEKAAESEEIAAEAIEEPAEEDDAD